MVEILRNKNMATKFQILAELANGGPHIQQRSIADNLGITPQAVSDYIRQLTQDGLISPETHAGYRLTVQGVNWIIQELRSLKEYSDFVVKSISDISVCAAVAEVDLDADRTVGLVMRDGFLWATASTGAAARGTTCNPAAAGEDVGIRNIQGIVSLKPGQATLLVVPSIQFGGSRRVDPAELKKQIKGKHPVCALGIEAVIALKKVYSGEINSLGAAAIIIEAAQHGLHPVMVCVENETAGLIKRLEDSRVKYSVVELSTGSL